MNDTPRVDEAILKSNGQWSYELANIARQLERELADMTAFRDSETRWAAQYKQECDEARKCLREIVTGFAVCGCNANQIYSHNTITKQTLNRWRKAVGMEEQ